MVSGVSSLIEAPESSQPVSPWVDAVRRRLSTNQEVGPHQTRRLPVPLILDFQPKDCEESGFVSACLAPVLLLWQSVGHTVMP